MQYLTRIVLLAFVFLPICLWADTTLKIAILDNPKIVPEDHWLSQELENSYVAGVEAATLAAKNEGIHVKYKTFFYSDDLMTIFKAIDQVKKWKPDAVIGVHNTDHLLLAAPHFPDVLLISLYATDVKVSQLSDNVYSLGLPDAQLANDMLYFIHKNFPNRNIFIIVDTTAKESEDLAALVTQKFKATYPNLSVTQSEFLGTNIKQLDMSTFLHNYQKGDVIITLSVVYYSMSEIMERITQYLHDSHVTFITPVDNGANQSMPSDVPATYEGFRLSPWVLDQNSDSFKTFAKNYAELYQQQPVNMVSYTTYQAVMSVVDAVKEFPSTNSHETTQQQVLDSFHAAVKKNPGWFRPQTDLIYKINKDREQLLGPIQQVQVK